MKERMEHQEAKDKSFKMKTGFKEGIIRIWQKIAEYQEISIIKTMQIQF